MDGDEISFRKHFLGLSKKDEELLQRIGDVLDAHADEIINVFYEHLLGFPETKAFFKDKKTLKRVKEFQKAYFKRLTKGNYDLEYFRKGVKIGEAHDRVKLPPKLYIGAYNKYHQIVIPKICEGLGYKDCDATLPVAAFSKIIFLDMTLAIDAYIASREASIKASDARYRGLVESAPNAIISVTGQDTIATWNSAAERIFGYIEEEVVGMPITLIISEDARQLHEKGFRNFIKNRGTLKRTFESEGLTKNGRTIPVEISLYAEMGASGYTCTAIISDITERKKAVDALRKSEAGLADAQRIAHLGNWDWDIENNELHWSDGIYRIFGLKPQEVNATYETFLNSVHPSDREFVKRSVDEALYEGKPYLIDHRIVLPDGAERIVYEKGEVTFDERSKPIRMLGVVQDITERKRAEEEIQKRVKELQEFHRLTVGRELKMIELEKEVERLKKEREGD